MTKKLGKTLGKLDNPVRRIFLKRSVAMLERLSSTASLDSLTEALAAPTDLGGVARLLGKIAAVEATDIDPLAAAYARGIETKREIAAEAGGLLSASTVAELLGISRQAVEKRRQRGQLLGVPAPGRGHLYPAIQFHDGRVIEGIEDVLTNLESDSPWTRLSFLVGRSASLGDKRVADALRAGDTRAVIQLARAFGEHAA